MKKIIRFYFLIMVLGSSAVAEAKVEFVPVSQIRLLGGQVFFDGKNTSITGNGDWLFAPGFKFGEKFSLVSSVNGEYRRLREVQELIGGSYLTQQTLENTSIVKGIYNFNDNWKGKFKGSYRNQLLVESADESLGNGLFDNNKIGFGMEMERTGSFFRSLRLSLDPYAVRFLRYTSLSSGSSSASEISSGDDPLDFNAYDAAVSVEMSPLRKTMIQSYLLNSYRIFTDQKKVTVSGTYTSEARKDEYVYGTLSVLQQLPDWSFIQLQSMAGLGFSAQYLISSQHNYDASKTRFNSNYYDYQEFHITPRLGAKWRDKLELSVAYDYAQRNYNHRVVQNSEGTYGTDRIVLDNQSVSYSLKYPLLLGFSVVAEGVWRQSVSNMTYESTYRYNYSAEHYFVGFSWDL